MFYGDQRDQTREFFFTVWNKMQAKSPLLPLEAQIASVLEWHPEYANVFSTDENKDADYTVENGESNPFLHMGMHLALREQLSTNRPLGIQEIHKKYCSVLGDAHKAEHLMFESLGEVLWQAQRNHQAPDEKRYLELLNERIPSAYSHK